MERPLDDLIGDVRAVIVAGIDVVYAGLHRLAQNCDRFVCVARRSEDLRASELHGTVAHAIHVQRCVRQREAASETYLAFRSS